jgi:hypothetical protein
MREKLRAEMTFLRSAAQYELCDLKTHEDIRDMLNKYVRNRITVDYRSKWTGHLLRINDTRTARLL